MPTLAPLLLAILPSDLKLDVVVDPGDVPRPPVCPVTMRLTLDDLPEGVDLSQATAWRGRLNGDLQSRVVQVRPTTGSDGGVDGLELAFFEYGLEPNEPVRRELVLTPVENTDGPGRFVLVQDDGARELRFGRAILWRHESAWDPARHEETFRPYTHLGGLYGERLTKGPGGLYPHHRGVFCGWTRVRVGGERHNFWSVPGEPRPHQEHRAWEAGVEWTGPITARVAAHTDWVTAAGEVLVEERREWSTWRYEAAPGLAHVLLDYRVTLTARGDAPVELDGDPAHAGFQIRLAQSVAEGKACTYVRPDSAGGGQNDNWSDAPWVAGRFPIGGRRYEVLFHDHPRNPAPTVFNTRDYGRFGPFFRTTLEPGEPLHLRYALRVRELVEDHPYTESLDPAGEHASWLAPVEARLAD